MNIVTETTRLCLDVSFVASKWTELHSRLTGCFSQPVTKLSDDFSTTETSMISKDIRDNCPSYYTVSKLPVVPVTEVLNELVVRRKNTSWIRRDEERIKQHMKTVIIEMLVTIRHHIWHLERHAETHLRHILSLTKEDLKKDKQTMNTFCAKNKNNMSDILNSENVLSWLKNRHLAYLPISCFPSSFFDEKNSSTNNGKLLRKNRAFFLTSAQARKSEITSFYFFPDYPYLFSYTDEPNDSEFGPPLAFSSTYNNSRDIWRIRRQLHSQDGPSIDTILYDETPKLLSNFFDHIIKLLGMNQKNDEEINLTKRIFFRSFNHRFWAAVAERMFVAHTWREGTECEMQYVSVLGKPPLFKHLDSSFFLYQEQNGINKSLSVVPCSRLTTPQPWSKTEDALLLQLAGQQDDSEVCRVDWYEVARSLEQARRLHDTLNPKTLEISQDASFLPSSDLELRRTPYECFRRFSSRICRQSRNFGPWTKTEDSALLELAKAKGADVETPHGRKSPWTEVARTLNRTYSDCRSRFLYALKTKHRIWSHYEDVKLQYLKSVYGSNWTAVSSHLSRTAPQCRERYEVICKRKDSSSAKKLWTESADEKLLEAVTNLGPGKWSQISRLLEGHWSDRQCCERWRILCPIDAAQYDIQRAKAICVLPNKSAIKKENDIGVAVTALSGEDIEMPQLETLIKYVEETTSNCQALRLVGHRAKRGRDPPSVDTLSTLQNVDRILASITTGNKKADVHLVRAKKFVRRHYEKTLGVAKQAFASPNTIDSPAIMQQ